MSDRAKIEELRDRLAAATGPDRELDRDIACALGWTDVRFVNGDWVGDDIDPNGNIGCFLPRWTASIDAAVTLVPKDCDWVINTYIRDNEVEAAIYPEGGRISRGKAATAPLALCAAAIEARTPGEGN